MTVYPTGTPENYTVEYLADILHLNHIKIGIMQEMLQAIVNQHIYNKEVLVAKGKAVQPGSFWAGLDAARKQIAEARERLAASKH